MDENIDVNIAIDNGFQAAIAMTRSSATVYTYSLVNPALDFNPVTITLSNGVDLGGNALDNALTTDNTFEVDNTNPTAGITYSDANGVVTQGDILTITATFSEPIEDPPTVNIAISGSNTQVATAMTITSSTVYTFDHTVGLGDGTATVSLSVGVDAGGNVVTAAPTSGATFIVDNTPPVITVPTVVTDVTAPTSVALVGGVFEIEASNSTGTKIDYGASATDVNDMASFDCVATSDDAVTPGSAVPTPTEVIASSTATVTVTNQLFEFDNLISETHTITCTATDEVGNNDSSSFDAKIQDTTDPVLTIPNPITVQTKALGDFDLITETFPQTESTTSIDRSTPPGTSVFGFYVEAADSSGTIVRYTGTATDDVGVKNFRCDSNKITDGLSTVNTIDRSVADVAAAAGRTSVDLDNGDEDGDLGNGQTGVALSNDELGQQFEIDGLDSETHTIICIADDTAVGIGTSQVSETLSVIIRDITPPKIRAPDDTTPVEATGINTPINVDIGAGPGPGGVYVTDLVSTGAAVTSGATFGQTTLSDDRPAQDAKCDDGENSGDTLACFQAGTTTVTWSIVDKAGNVAVDTQDVVITFSPVVLGWEVETATVVQLVDSTNILVEDSETLKITDIRSNLDSQIRDSLTVHFTSDSDPTSLDVTFTELTKNNGIFVVDTPVKFTTGGTNALANELLVAVGNAVTAAYTSPVDSVSNPVRASGNDDTVTATVVDFNPFNPVPPGINPIRLISGGVATDVITTGSAGLLRVQDDTFINAASNEVVLTALSMTSRNSGGTITDGPHLIALTEDANTGDLVSQVNIAFNPNISDPVAGVIKAPVGDTVTFSYTSPNDSTVVALDVAVIDFLPEDYALSTFATSYGQNLSCAAFASVDNDGDGICDVFETSTGLLIVNEATETIWFLPCDTTLDRTGDGIPDDCPSTSRKDLYYEIDFMPNHEPSVISLDLIIQAFDKAPIDGGLGVNFHPIVSEDTLDHILSADADTLQNIKNTFYGTPQERAGTCTGCEGTGPNIIDNKRLVVRYLHSIHNLAGEALGASGKAEVGGNDAWVSLGSFGGSTGNDLDWGTSGFHEIGHNLGLGHGGKGAATDNCKPHYISVMNYLYQFPFLLTSSWQMDYSRQDLGMLRTNFLNEAGGVALYQTANHDTGLVEDRRMVFGGTDGSIVEIATGVGVNWDRTGGVNQDVNAVTFAPINNVNIAGCSASTTPGVNVDIPGSDDWANLDFIMMDSDTFADGAAPLEFSLGGKRGLDHPTREANENLFAAKLNPTEAGIQDLIDNGGSTCSDADLNGLLSEIDDIQDIFTIDDPSKDLKAKLLEVLTELSLEPTGLIFSGPFVSCTTPDVKAALDSAIESYLAALDGTVEMQVESDQIAITQFGNIAAVIFGSQDFNVQSIDATTVRLATVDDEDGGAGISHDFGNPTVLKRHENFIDQDEFLDVRFHFSAIAIGLDLEDNNEQGEQRVCIRGEGDQVFPLPFHACDDVLVVSNENTIPIVTITAPVNFATFSSGEIIGFTATATDIEDDDAVLTSSITWTSSIDGTLVDGGGLPLTGGSISAILSDGDHVITATVADSAGKIDTSSITISVGTGAPPPTPETLVIQSITYSPSGGKFGFKHLNIDVKAKNGVGDPVVDATITLELFRNGLIQQTYSGLTGMDGIVSFTFSSAPDGEYTSVITTAAASGLIWNEITPPNSHTKITP